MILPETNKKINFSWTERVWEGWRFGWFYGGFCFYFLYSFSYQIYVCVNICIHMDFLAYICLCLCIIVGFIYASIYLDIVFKKCCYIASQVYIKEKGSSKKNWTLQTTSFEILLTKIWKVFIVFLKVTTPLLLMLNIFNSPI